MQKLSFLFFFLFLVFNLHAQVPTGPSIAWQRCYGTSGYDVFSDAISTSYGGFLAFVVYGNEDGDFTDTLNTHSRLLKFDSAMNMIWQRSYDDIAFENLLEVEDGYILCCATYVDTGIASTNHGLQDYLLVKTDLNGVFQWSRCYGSPGSESFSNITHTQDGGYLITGSSYSSGGDIPSHYGSGFTTDAIIIKIDSIGNIQWVKVLGGSDNDGVVGQVFELTENIYTISIGSVSNDYDLYDSGIIGTKFWLLKCDSAGDIVDDNFIQGDSDFYSITNAIEYKSGILFTSISNPESINFPAPEGHASYDVGLGIIDSNLNLVNLLQYGGSKSDVMGEIIEIDNTFYISGYSNSDDYDLPANFNSGEENDYWILAVDSNFNLLWSKNFGGSNPNGEYTYKLNSPGYITIQNNFLYFFGQCQVPDTFPDHDINCGFVNPDLDDDTDAWLVAFDLNTNIHDIPNNKNNFTVYPNPADKIVYVQLENTDATCTNEILITDISGKIISSEKCSSGMQITWINTSELKAGIYFISLKCNGEKTETQKLVIE